MNITTAQKNLIVAVLKQEKEHGLDEAAAVKAVAHVKKISVAKVTEAMALNHQQMEGLAEDRINVAPRKAPATKNPVNLNKEQLTEAKALIVGFTKKEHTLITAAGHEVVSIAVPTTISAFTADSKVSYRVRLANGKTRPRSCNLITFAAAVTARPVKAAPTDGPDCLKELLAI